MGIIKFVICLAIGILIGQFGKNHVLAENVKNHRFYLEQQCIRFGKETVQLKGKTLGVFPAPAMECTTVIQSLHAAHGG